MTRFSVIFELLDSSKPVTQRALFQRLKGTRRSDKNIIASTCAELVAHGLADCRERHDGTHEYSVNAAGHDVLRDQP